MKPSKILTSAAAATLLVAATPGIAQVSADGMGKIVPVELYACDFVDGKGRADLDSVIERWNDYSDDNDMDDYAAWLLTPFFSTPEQDFDIIWLGAYRDGKAMGSRLQEWIESGGELMAAFAEVVDCKAHVAYSSAMYKAPSGGNVPESGIITMMDCELNDGHRYSDVQAAELKWMDHLKNTGSKAAYYHWMPMFGGGEAEFDYKVVLSYPDFEAVGASFDMFANEGGRDVSTEIFGNIDDCDDARVYVTNSIRSAKIRD